jgi:hypothetical protein
VPREYLILYQGAAPTNHTIVLSLSDLFEMPINEESLGTNIWLLNKFGKFLHFLCKKCIYKSKPDISICTVWQQLREQVTDCEPLYRVRWLNHHQGNFRYARRNIVQVLTFHQHNRICSMSTARSMWSNVSPCLQIP